MYKVNIEYPVESESKIIKGQIVFFIGHAWDSWVLLYEQTGGRNRVWGR